MENNPELSNAYYCFVGSTLRFLLVILVILSGLSMMACSTRGIDGTISGTVKDPGISTGSSAPIGTRNQPPQGGIDEKSYRSPIEPSS